MILNGKNSLTFAPITPVPSNVTCECGHNEWNATNFSNLIHFCPNREIDVFITDFRANNSTIKRA